ncbi:hypothetical protein AB0D12_32045 [Streptomyces sp. NPDC048479]|uniref:hypothetical protein n=1 Tax=Streptomyces sp. NPDC048479 TaxID=3154725 RepID=UPI0034203C82
MGMGDDDTAARRLRLLQQELLDPWRMPEDREGSRSARPASRGQQLAHSPSPIHLGILDHMMKTRAEAIAHTRAVAPNAGPVPAEAAAVYDWMRQQTAHLGEEQQQTRETVIYRQGLEHAIAMGDTKVVRPHPCPACRCWGLEWDSGRQRAVCTYRPCSDERGMTHAWKLAELADHHVTAKKMLKVNAT